MMRWLSRWLLMSLGATILIALFLRHSFLDQNGYHPRTLEEAVITIEARGLFYRSTARDPSMKTCAIIVSTHPVTWEQAHNIHVNQPDHASWHDTVVIYSSWRTLMANFDPSASVVWGELFVYGNPQIIEKLTGRKPTGPRAEER